MVLEKSDTTILSQNDKQFDLHLIFPFPVIPIENNSQCKVSAESIMVMKNVRNHAKRVLVSRLHNAMAKADSSLDVLRSFDQLTNYNIEDMTSWEKLGHEEALRQKRALQYLNKYWTLSGWSENMFRKQSRWNKEHFEKTSRRITDLGIAIEQEKKTIQHFKNIMCKSAEDLADGLETFSVIQTFSRSIRDVALQIQFAENGLLPNIVTGHFLKDFCITHFRQNSESQFCNKVNLRRMFRPTLKNIGMSPRNESIIVSLKVVYPETDVRLHQIYKVNILPIFDNLNRVLSLDLGTQYLAMTLERSRVVLGYTRCDLSYDHVICNQRADVNDQTCLRNTVKKNDTDVCFFKSRPSNDKCFYIRLQDGIIFNSVESNRIISNRKQNSADIFGSPATSLNGIFFVENSPKSVKTTICNGQVVKTQLQLNVTYTMYTQRPVVMGNIFKVNRHFNELQKDIDKIGTDMTVFRNNSYEGLGSAGNIVDHVGRLDAMGIIRLVLDIFVILLILVVITFLGRKIITNIQKCRPKTIRNVNTS